MRAADDDVDLLRGVGRHGLAAAGRWAGRCSRAASTRAPTSSTTGAPARRTPCRATRACPHLPWSRTGWFRGPRCARSTRLWFRKAPRRRDRRAADPGDVLPSAGRRARVEPALRSGRLRAVPARGARRRGRGRPRRRTPSGRQRARVVPGGAQALRPGRRRAAVLPDGRLDAGARPAGPTRAWPPLLDDLDALVVEAGGRVYLAKDARLSPETVRGDVPARSTSSARVRDRVDPGRIFTLRPRPAASSCDRSEPSMINALGRPQSLLLLGGTSEIALAVARAAGPTLRPRGRPGRPARRASRRGRRRACAAAGLDGARGRLRRRGHRHAPRRWSRPSRPSATSTSPWSPSACSATRSRPGRTTTPRVAPRQGQLHRRRSASASPGRRDAPPGPRRDRRAVVGRGGAGASLELRLRLDQGRHGRLLPRARRGAAGARRAACSSCARASCAPG